MPREKEGFREAVEIVTNGFGFKLSVKDVCELDGGICPRTAVNRYKGLWDSNGPGKCIMTTDYVSRSMERRGRA